MRVTEKRTRRRGAALEQAILDAAWAELSERGWAGFTIEGIAARAGTAKTVIYRRWGNRVHLAQEMLLRQTATDVEFEVTGDLREDLLAFVRDMSLFLRSPFGEAVRGVISEGDSSTQPSLFTPAAVVARVAEIVAQARARGDLPGEPAAIAMNLGHGMVMSEFLHTGAPPADEGLVALVDRVWLPALHSTAVNGSAGPGTA